jgi:hypothetical protein
MAPETDNRSLREEELRQTRAAGHGAPPLGPVALPPPPQFNLHRPSQIEWLGLD